MYGNPYYQPNYEEYYHQPWWYDRVQDPESWHAATEYGKTIARKSGPLLPAAAILAPMVALGYTVSEGRRISKEKALRKQEEAELKAIEERKQREQQMEEAAKLDDIRYDLHQLGKRLPMLLEAKKASLIQDQSDIPIYSELAEEPVVIEDIKPKPKSKSRSRSPSLPPTFNIEFPRPIHKKANVGFISSRYDKEARAVMDSIQKHGFRTTLNDPIIKANFPDMVNILSDVSGAMNSDMPFPEPFTRLLTAETVRSYNKQRQAAKDIKKKDTRGRQQARNRTLQPHRYGTPKPTMREPKNKGESIVRVLVR